MDSAAPTRGIHLMAKPAGPTCNLRCTYCFYSEKTALFAPRARCRMSDEVLEAYVRECASANRDAPAPVTFAWQGGEPTLVGLDFFTRAVALERRYTAGKPFTNTLQTNGMLLNDRWCEFLAENRFLVGLSLDGPAWLHDRYRTDARGRPTHHAVMGALRLLAKHGVECNILACVTRESAQHPLEVYDFFRSEGVEFIQFLPIVERLPDRTAAARGYRLAPPPEPDAARVRTVTPWTVEPAALGDFYARIFDEWVRCDVGRRFIMNFEWLLHAYLGGDGPVCYSSEHCGRSCICEHNGDVYACDHYVYPEYKLGNILVDELKKLVESPAQVARGRRKAETLTASCRECDILALCRGGCPKHRFAESPRGEPGVSYLCPAYRRFYTHARKYLAAFRVLIEHGIPGERIMQAIDRPLLIAQGPGREPVMLLIDQDRHDSQRGDGMPGEGGRQ